MSLSYDPWNNPELAPRRKPALRAWRAGRTRVFHALLATAGLYAVYTLVAGEHGLVQLRAYDRKEARVRAEIAATEKRIQELDRKLAEIDLTIEEEARIEYGYIGPNELVYEEEEADSAGVAPPTAGEHGGRATEVPQEP